jgi:hypothetical protein
MEKVDPLDFDYTDGCDYILTRKIYTVGTLQYTFIASDGLYVVSNGPYTNLIVDAAPILRNPSVSPSHGEVSVTEFCFRVQYLDYDNNAPTYMNITIDGSDYAMGKENIYDNNYADGCYYVFYMTFSSTGNFQYNFSTSDGKYSTILGQYNVNVHLTNPPIIYEGEVTPTLGEIHLQTFTFMTT